MAKKREVVKKHVCPDCTHTEKEHNCPDCPHVKKAKIHGDPMVRLS